LITWAKTDAENIATKLMNEKQQEHMKIFYKIEKDNDSYIVTVYAMSLMLADKL